VYEDTTAGKTATEEKSIGKARPPKSKKQPNDRQPVRPLSHDNEVPTVERALGKGGSSKMPKEKNRLRQQKYRGERKASTRTLWSGEDGSAK